MGVKYRLHALVAGLAIAATACGGSTSGTPVGDASTTTSPASTTTTTATTTTAPPVTTPVGVASLDITIGTKDTPAEFTAALTCGEKASATGYLADTAQDACDLLASSDEARSRLIDGPPADRACTEIYGGGEVADITGTLDGSPVSTTVNRADGCGIADWDLLRPILVEPYDMLRQFCSAARRPARDADPQGDLPAVVADLRDHLVNLASVCDYEGLAAIATRDKTRISFGGPEDPAAFWSNLEANGETPMADMVSVLELAPGTVDAGDGSVSYVWPAVFALDDWSQATPDQRQELADVFGQDALADWDSFGGYIGYRVGITEDGHWAYFVSGD
jgi:hypothetical protein